MSTLAEKSKFSYPAASGSPMDPDFQFNRSPYIDPALSPGSTSNLLDPLSSASNVSLNKQLPEPPAVLTPLRVSGAFEWVNKSAEPVPPLPPLSFAQKSSPTAANKPPVSAFSPVSRYSFTAQTGHAAKETDVDGLGRDPQRHVSWKLIYPALLVMLVAAGLATLLLVYVLIMRSVDKEERMGLNQLYGAAFYVKEGSDAQRMLGLMISKVTTEVVALTSPVLISVYAYCVAGLWLSSQSHKERTHRRGVSLPTPLQYGKLMTLLAAPSLKNVLNMARYLTRGGRRPHAPVFVSVGFWGVASVVVNGLLISLADVWLHATATVIYTELQTPSSPQISMLITRYPLPPLLTYILLVYIYALIALFIYLFAIIVSSPEVPLHDGSIPTALELTQVQLVDPLAMVANLWPSPRRMHTGRGVRDMFTEDDDIARLEVGLDPSTGSGYGADFRVHRRAGKPPVLSM